MLFFWLQFGQVKKSKEYAGGKSVENSLKAYFREVKKVRGYVVSLCLSLVRPYWLFAKLYVR